MWRPRLSFVTIHYAYILTLSLLAFPILYPGGNLAAIDAFFFGVSAGTVTGLNTSDVKNLKLYQQLFLYFVPLVGNMGVINIVVLCIRLFWFKRHLKQVAPRILLKQPRPLYSDLETPDIDSKQNGRAGSTAPDQVNDDEMVASPSDHQESQQTIPADTCTAPDPPQKESEDTVDEEVDNPKNLELTRRITFDPATDQHPRRERDTALYIPGPRDRDRGHPLVELRDGRRSQDDLSIHSLPGPNHSTVRRRIVPPGLSSAKSLERVVTVASSMFVIGNETRHRRSSISHRPTSAANNFPRLSKTVTVGRNSHFKNLSKQDREELGGIEYQSLKLLLKIVLGYVFALHIVGVVGLVIWIHNTNHKYRDYLQESGADKTWWAIFSAQTMVDNLGFTLTSDSMISFNDARWPMLLMSFCALAGHTCYPVFLRLIIWTISKIVRKNSSMQEPLSFLLKHPRRCYTLLFPSSPTWVLFGIVFVLNFIDTLLIIILDLDNPAVNTLPPGHRLAAAVFQSASARHTGTTSFNLAAVNPAVQFSLFVMMYISIYPIAMSIRTSNTYEEKSLGIYKSDQVSVDEGRGRSYLLSHLQNQLSFDMWYIFLGIFCICIAESDHVMDEGDPSFALFPIFFEVMSAYCNVGLSLGHPSISASLSGKLRTFSKLVICAMMLRGRHRGLPYRLDRAIILPDERLIQHDEGESLDREEDQR